MNTKKYGILILILLVSLFSHESQAQAVAGGSGLLDNVLSTYKSSASSWVSVIKDSATMWFWSLALISMVWTFGMLFFKQAGIAEFFGEFIRFSVFTGFFKWLLNNSPQMPMDIMKSLMMLGTTASNGSGMLSPSGIVDIGFQLLSTVTTNSSAWDPINSALGIVITGIILVVLALIGVNMLILLISGWILAYAGILFLGFGGSRWTSDMAISYYKTILSIGMQTMTMILLIGIGQTFINDYYAALAADLSFFNMLVLLVAAVVLLVLTNKVPSLVGGIAMGGGAGAMGGGFGAASIVAAATGMAVAGEMMATKMTGAAANLAGAAQAIKAAAQSMNGSDSADSGTGGSDGFSTDTSSLFNMPDSNNSGGGAGQSEMGNSGRTQASQSSPFSEFMGTTNSSASLAKATAQVVGEKFQGFKDAAQARIDQTIPGQIASVIRNNDDAPISGEPGNVSNGFSGDSLSGSVDGATNMSDESQPNQQSENKYADEIDAFVNRTRQSE